MILHKDIILRRTDNPHELLIAVCANCKERREESRIKLHLDGWTSLTGCREVFCVLQDVDLSLCSECSHKEEIVMSLEDKMSEDEDFD